MGKYFGTDGFRGEAGIDLTADHAYKAAHRFLVARHFIDKTENEFSLTPCVAGIDDFGNVCPVHKLL